MIYQEGRECYAEGVRVFQITPNGVAFFEVSEEIQKKAFDYLEFKDFISKEEMYIN